LKPPGPNPGKWAAAVLAALVWLSAAACGGAADSPGSPTPGATTATRKRVEVVASHPHDRGAFTQGLLVHDGALYESTGLNGRSTVREVETETGRVIRSAALPEELFGEGLAQVEDRLVQLTWTSGVARIYEIPSFDVVGEWRYQGEGWGLCHDGARFVMSNGSSRLTFRDDESFAEIGGVDVTLDGRSLTALNELECVEGRVYANVWRTESIAEIDPATGVVTAFIDAAGLLSDSERAGTDVMNGIAWDGARRSFYVTGKLWPRLFEVRFVAP
jgi:glutaminyl-peptide cyclotransferase